MANKLWQMTGFGKISPDIKLAKALTHFQSIAQQIAIERAHRMAPLLANKANLVLDSADEALVRQAADHAGRVAEPGEGHRHIRLGAADMYIEFGQLHQALVSRRTHAKQQFTEADNRGCHGRSTFPPR